MYAAALWNVAVGLRMPALPRTGLADTFLIVVGAALVGGALIAAILMMRNRG